MGDIVRHIGRNVKLGKNVKIWHFAYVGDNTEIGENTKIGSLAHVDYDVKIGRDCKIEGTAYLPPKTVIEDGVFVGPGVVFTNDPYPMSKRMKGVHIERGAIICAGAVLKAGIRVGADAGRDGRRRHEGRPARDGRIRQPRASEVPAGEVPSEEEGLGGEPQRLKDAGTTSADPRTP